METTCIDNLPMSPTSLGRVAAMLRFVGSVSNLSLLTIRDYYYHFHDKMVKRKMVTGQGYGWVLVGVKGCVLWPTGHSSVTLFPYLCGLRTGRSIRHRGQVTDLLSRAHTWVWAQGRLVALLSWIRLFPDRLMGGRVVEVLTPHWVRDLGVGAWSPSLDGDLDTQDKRVMGWSCLCLGYKRGVCFRVPSWAHWFANHRVIRYDLCTI